MSESDPRGSDISRLSKDLLSHVLATSSDAICINSLADGKFLYANDSLVKMTGYERDELLGKAPLDIGIWDSQEARDELRQGLTDRGSVSGVDFRFRLKNGRIMHTEISAQVVRVDGETCVLTMARDVSERRRVEEELRRRDAILQASAFAAARFLRATSWESCMEEVLERLGTAAGADRSYLFENHSGPDGRLLTSQRFEWLSEGLPSSIEFAENHDFPYEEGFGRWVDVLGAGGVIRGRASDFPESERSMLGESVSMLIVPVFAGGEWWGYMGFECMSGERECSAPETDALRVAAETLGASIERHTFEERLQETEITRRNLMERIPGVVYMETLEEGNPDIYVSPQYAEMFGEPPETRLGQPLGWRELIHPDDQQRIVAESERTNETLEPFQAEYRVCRPDGVVRWVRDECVVVRDDAGEPLYWLGLITDIQERKESDQRLLSAETRFRTLVEQIPVATYIETPEDEKEAFYISPQIEGITGYPPEAFRDPKFWESKIHPDDREAVLAEEERARRAGEPFDREYRYVAADGRTIWLREESQTVPREGREPLSQGIIADVTEAKHVEEEIRRGAAVLQAVSFAAERFLEQEDWGSVMDEVLARLGSGSDVSRAYLFEVREGSEGLFSFETFEWCAPDIESTMAMPRNQGFRVTVGAGDWEDILISGNVVQRVAAEYSVADQEYLKEEGILSLIAVPIFVGGRWWGYLGFDDCEGERGWSSGEVEALRSAASILGSAVARREAEVRLREAEATHRTLIERVPAVIYISELNRGGVLTYVSPQYERLFGYTPEERLADPRLWMKLCHPDDLDGVIEASRRADETGGPFTREYRMFHADGHMLWVSDEAVIVHDDEGKPLYWLGMVLDITSRKIAEDELRRHDAILEAVGFAAAQFLYAESWEDCVDDVLRHLGRAGEVSRTYLFQNRLGGDGRLRSSPTHEWVAEGVGRQLENPRAQNLLVSGPSREQDGSPGWAKTLSGGGTFHAIARDLAEAERVLLEVRDVVSILEVPIFVRGEWWGFLGFDECVEERRWSQAEIEALRAAAGVLGAVVERGEAEVKLRKAEERHRLLVEQLPAVVYIDAIDDVSTAMYISPQVEGVLGYTAEERLASPRLWTESLHPDDREAVMAESERTNRTGDPFKMDYRMIARDDRTVWLRDEAVMVRDEDGRPMHWQGVMFDITERKHAEEELERALKLERDVAERLRSLDEMKNTFLTAVSHDLRTPLAAVLGLALTLERDDIGLDDRETRDLAHRIATNARKLDRLVTDLLDLDRLSRGILEPNLSRTDLGLLVRKVVEEADFLGEHPVTVEAESVAISVDTAKVERIVENLIANSVRHTPSGTRVWVRVQPEGTGALLLVEDEGPGVLAELREAVFEPFRQGSSGGPSPGVGIGLSLVARFTELHGGRAWVADREGGGASFRVFLPDAEHL